MIQGISIMNTYNFLQLNVPLGKLCFAISLISCVLFVLTMTLEFHECHHHTTEVPILSLVPALLTGK